MEKIELIYNELRSQPFKTGLMKLVKDVDVDVDEYMAHIMGFASSFLHEQEINPEEVTVDTELGDRLAKCVERLAELQLLKNKVDELARSLLDKSRKQ